MEFDKTRDFFEAFKGNQISSLDQLNYIEEKTKNDPKKLKALIADLEIYMGGFEIKKWDTTGSGICRKRGKA